MIYHLRFIYLNLTTYLKVKHNVDMKIFGNPFYREGFINHLREILRNKTIKLVNFHSNIFKNEKNKVNLKLKKFANINFNKNIFNNSIKNEEDNFNQNSPNRNEIKNNNQSLRDSFKNHFKTSKEKKIETINTYSLNNYLNDNDKNKTLKKRNEIKIETRSKFMMVVEEYNKFENEKNKIEKEKNRRENESNILRLTKLINDSDK